MRNEILDKFVASGDIISYTYENLIDEEFPASREAEQLIITFPSGEVLTIDTFCSGSGENTGMVFTKLTEK